MKKVYSGITPVFSFFGKRVMRFAFLFAMIFFLNSFESFGQLTYTWNQTGAADWTVASNWTPVRGTPAPNDILQFNNGSVTTPINIPTQIIGQLSVSANTIVNLQGAAAATLLTISGLPGDDLTVATGSELAVNGINTTTIFLNTGATGVITGIMTFSNAAHRLDAADASGIIFNSPATFTQAIGCTGNIFTALGTNNAVVFNTGSRFQQIDGGNPFAKTQPASKVVFNTGSLFLYQVTSSSPSFSGRTYADLQFMGSGTASTCTGASAVSIDNFSVVSGTINVNMTGTPGHVIKGNLIVAGGGATINFNPASTGTINFSGISNQNITNSGTLTFGSNQLVTINNAAGITINSDITLNNLVTFTSGIITIPNPRMLTLSSTASVASVSNASYVNGMVKKIGNTTFKFPVGKSIGATKAYVPIEISAPSLITDEFTAEYIRSSAITAFGNTYVTGLDHVSSVDYWTLGRAGTSTVDVTLYWTSLSSSGGSASYINDLPSLVVAHFNGTSWDNFGGIMTATGSVLNGSVTWPAVTAFSPFSLGSINFLNPLPINLNYLNGFKQGNNNLLNWKVTCTNNPSATMSVQRSTDGRNYNSITTVFADALRCQQPFDYTDNNAPAGLNYYRLKMVDANGKITYSAPIAILNKETGFDIVGLSPTLVNTKAELNVTAAQKTTMTVVITDIAGKQVQKIAYNLIAGSNKFTVNAAGLKCRYLSNYGLHGRW